MGVPLSATLVAQVDEVAKSLGVTPLSARTSVRPTRHHRRRDRRRRFSLRFYRQPEVADACIALQEEAGVDVNLLLFLLWHATMKRASRPRRSKHSSAVSAPGAT